MKKRILSSTIGIGISLMGIVSLNGIIAKADSVSLNGEEASSVVKDKDTLIATFKEGNLTANVTDGKWFIEGKEQRVDGVITVPSINSDIAQKIPTDVVQEIPTKLDKVVLPESKSIELQQTPKYSDVVQEIPTKLDKVVLPESKSIELQQTPKYSDV
ncbi:hypothetical protein, partial [Carnobacterium maltaromaticum]|uniref:hypothetical protein n=1 Tax=Carnobacterium maltaromaticum TaxID=2751 RepID=UPI001072B674